MLCDCVSIARQTLDFGHVDNGVGMLRIRMEMRGSGHDHWKAPAMIGGASTTVCCGPELDWVEIIDRDRLGDQGGQGLVSDSSATCWVGAALRHTTTGVDEDRPVALLRAHCARCSGPPGTCLFIQLCVRVSVGARLEGPARQHKVKMADVKCGVVGQTGPRTVPACLSS